MTSPAHCRPSMYVCCIPAGTVPGVLRSERANFNHQMRPPDSPVPCRQPEDNTTVACVQVSNAARRGACGGWGLAFFAAQIMTGKEQNENVKKWICNKLQPTPFAFSTQCYAAERGEGVAHRTTETTIWSTSSAGHWPPKTAAPATPLLCDVPTRGGWGLGGGITGSGARTPSPRGGLQGSQKETHGADGQWVSFFFEPFWPAWLERPSFPSCRAQKWFDWSNAWLVL